MEDLLDWHRFDVIAFVIISCRTVQYSAPRRNFDYLVVATLATRTKSLIISKGENGYQSTNKVLM